MVHWRQVGVLVHGAPGRRAALALAVVECRAPVAGFFPATPRPDYDRPLVVCWCGQKSLLLLPTLTVTLYLISHAVAGMM